MYTLIVGIIIFCAILLVISVLAQNSKGGGISSQFGGSGASNMFGVKKTGDFLEKSSWVLAITIIVLSLSTTLNFVVPKQSGPSNEILDKASEEAPAGTQNQTPILPVAPSDSAG